MRAGRAVIILVAAGLLVTARESHPARADDAMKAPHYRLTAAAVACFIQNREIYKAASGEPVFLLADNCPPKRPPSFLDALTNEGPNVRLDPKALDRLVTLKRAQLVCLDRLSVTASDAIVLFFPDACRVEPAPLLP